jgi:hypothetical protein
MSYQTETNRKLTAIQKLLREQCGATGTGTGGGDASEATLLLMLAELEKLVPDVQLFAAQLSSDPTQTFIVKATSDNGITSFTRLDTGTGLASNSFEPLESAGGDTYELVPVYDTNGVTDLSNLTKLFENIQIDRDGVRTVSGYYAEDRSTVATPSAVANIIRDLGEETKTNVVTFVLDNTPGNNTFTTSGLMQSLLVDVVSISNTLTPPTITTYVDPTDVSTILIKPLRVNRPVSFQSENGDVRLVENITITANPGDIIDITYTTKITF